MWSFGSCVWGLHLHQGLLRCAAQASANMVTMSRVAESVYIPNHGHLVWAPNAKVLILPYTDRGLTFKPHLKEGKEGKSPNSGPAQRAQYHLVNEHTSNHIKDAYTLSHWGGIGLPGWVMDFDLSARAVFPSTAILSIHSQLHCHPPPTEFHSQVLPATDRPKPLGREFAFRSGET